MALHGHLLTAVASMEPATTQGKSPRPEQLRMKPVCKTCAQERGKRQDGCLCGPTIPTCRCCGLEVWTEPELCDCSDIKFCLGKLDPKQFASECNKCMKHCKDHCQCKGRGYCRVCSEREMEKMAVEFHRRLRRMMRVCHPGDPDYDSSPEESPRHSVQSSRSEDSYHSTTVQT